MRGSIPRDWVARRFQQIVKQCMIDRIGGGAGQMRCVWRGRVQQVRLFQRHGKWRLQMTFSIAQRSMVGSQHFVCDKSKRWSGLKCVHLSRTGSVMFTPFVNKERNRTSPVPGALGLRRHVRWLFQAITFFIGVICALWKMIIVCRRGELMKSLIAVFSSWVSLFCWYYEIRYSSGSISDNYQSSHAFVSFVSLSHFQPLQSIMQHT